MNAPICQCKRKEWLPVKIDNARIWYLDNFKVSIYPFVLTLIIAAIFTKLNAIEFVDENKSLVNLRYGAVGSACCVLFATIVRLITNEKLLKLIVRFVLFVSNIASDIAYGALGFFVGSQYFSETPYPQLAWWFFGGLLYWLVINFLYMQTNNNKITRSQLKWLAFISICVAVVTPIVLFFLMKK